MIKVEIENNKIEIKGHANYDDYGKDIVCASVSSIVITTINAIIEFDPESIYYEDLNNRILIKKLKDDDITNKLINNMNKSFFFPKSSFFSHTFSLCTIYCKRILQNINQWTIS